MSHEPNKKGDPAIIARLIEAMQRGPSKPAFARGRMFYDFELGKVRIERNK